MTNTAGASGERQRLTAVQGLAALCRLRYRLEQFEHRPASPASAVPAASPPSE